MRHALASDWGVACCGTFWPHWVRRSRLKGDLQADRPRPYRHCPYLGAGAAAGAVVQGWMATAVTLFLGEPSMTRSL